MTYEFNCNYLPQYRNRQYPGPASSHSSLNIDASFKEESVSNPDSPASPEQAALNAPQIPLHPSSPTPNSTAPFNAMAAAGRVAEFGGHVFKRIIYSCRRCSTTIKRRKWQLEWQLGLLSSLCIQSKPQKLCHGRTSSTGRRRPSRTTGSTGRRWRKSALFLLSEHVTNDGANTDRGRSDWAERPAETNCIVILSISNTFFKCLIFVHFMHLQQYFTTTFKIKHINVFIYVFEYICVLVIPFACFYTDDSFGSWHVSFPIWLVAAASPPSAGSPFPDRGVLWSLEKKKWAWKCDL